MKGRTTGKSGMWRRSKYRAGRRFYLNLVILLAAAVVIFAAVKEYEKKISHDTFYEGIYIDDTAVGGLTREQALDRLSPAQEQKLDLVNIRLQYEGREWTLDREAVRLTSNIRQVVEEGFKIGRSGNVLNRFREIMSLRSNPVKLYSEVSYHANELEEVMDEIEEELNIPPVDAYVDFRPDEKVKFIIHEEKTGRLLDTEAVYRAIRDNLSKGVLDFAVQLQFQEAEPGVRAADFAGKTEKLVTFGTDLSKSAPDRTHNVVKAASQFNGLVVQPGEILSFNQVVGERTAEKGYRAAPMITADKSMKDAIGGGVSQTSTTLYNAAIRAGLEVVEYQRHSFPVAYIDKGLDTTVNLPMPVIDLKVKNTKDSPIYIRTFYANQKVYFEIYGQPLPNGRTIRIRTEEYETVPAPETEIRRDEAGQYVTYEDEEYVHVTPRQGYKVRVYREILEGDKVIETELLDDHYYRPIAGITYVGVKKRPKVEQEPEVSPTPSPAATPENDFSGTGEDSADEGR